MTAPRNSWHVEVILDGLLPLEVQHEMAVTGQVSLWNDGGTNRTSVRAWVDDPLARSLAEVLELVRRFELGERKVARIEIDTYQEWSERIERQYGQSTG